MRQNNFIEDELLPLEYDTMTPKNVPPPFNRKRALTQARKFNKTATPAQLKEGKKWPT